MATKSLKMLQKCLGESTLSITQVFEWHKAFIEGREVVENLPHASRPSTSVNDDNIVFFDYRGVVHHKFVEKSIRNTTFILILLRFEAST